MDSIVSPDLGRLIVEQLILCITSDNSSNTSSVKHTPPVQAELDALNRAATAQLVYVMDKEEMSIRKGTNIVRRILLMMFLWIRENRRTKMADMNIPTDSMVSWVS
jgi:KUP system potassium uptake protein